MSYTLQADHSFSGGIPNPPYKIDESVKDRIDPEYANFFEENLTENSNILYTHRVPLNEIRQGGNVMPGQSPVESLHKIYDIEIDRKHTEGPKIPARIFIPNGNEPENGWPVLLWFHGGGWVLGYSVERSTENSYCSKMAKLSECIVVSVDYRLAPENPFPAAVHDSFEALLYVFEQGSKDLGINNKKIAVGGSSAGGNLAAVISHKFANSPLSKNLPPIVFQLLVVPVTDNTATRESQPSWGENEFTPQLPAEKMLWYRTLYLPNGGDDLTNPESSPLFYPDESFKKLPPCLIAAAGCDILRSEAEAYNVKLKRNGIKSDINIYPGVPHPVMAMDAVLEKGRQLVKDTSAALKIAFE